MRGVSQKSSKVHGPTKAWQDYGGFFHKFDFDPSKTKSEKHSNKTVIIRFVVLLNMSIL